MLFSILKKIYVVLLFSINFGGMTALLYFYFLERGPLYYFEKVIPFASFPVAFFICFVPFALAQLLLISFFKFIILKWLDSSETQKEPDR